MTGGAQPRLRAEFAGVADAIARGAVECPGGVPGVVALATGPRETLYARAFGVRDIASGTPMTLDTVLCLYSCTKAITAATVMQLVERGRLRLKDPARAYVPAIGAIPVLDGFAPNGEPRLRAAASDVTIEQLLLHTAGFGYEFFNAELLRFTQSAHAAQAATGTMPPASSVLLFDPGTRWEYGRSLDWVSCVVEAIHGQPFARVVRETICEPLGMQATGFRLSPEMAARRATIHLRAADGTLKASPRAGLPVETQPDSGGTGLFSTAGDFAKFMRMMLGDGRAASGERVLAPATIEQMTVNRLAPLAVHPLPGTIPALANAAEFFPGLRKSWGYGGMINDELAPTGRPAGALAWAGLANLYYWIDRRNGVGGFWGTQILPFIDGVSLPAYLAFERSVYASIG